MLKYFYFPILPMNLASRKALILIIVEKKRENFPHQNHNQNSYFHQDKGHRQSPIPENLRGLPTLTNRVYFPY